MNYFIMTSDEHIVFLESAETVFDFLVFCLLQITK